MARLRCGVKGMVRRNARFGGMPNCCVGFGGRSDDERKRGEAGWHDAMGGTEFLGSDNDASGRRSVTGIALRPSELWGDMQPIYP